VDVLRLRKRLLAQLYSLAILIQQGCHGAFASNDRFRSLVGEGHAQSLQPRKAAVKRFFERALGSRPVAIQVALCGTVEAFEIAL